MPGPERITKEILRREIESRAERPELLREYLEEVLPFFRGPSIDDFSPRKGYPGSVLKIRGSNFAKARADNEVTVGGKPALVVEASPTDLKVITDPATVSGPVKVKVGAKTAAGPRDFRVLPYPKPGSKADGPPIFFAGKGMGSPGDVPSTGTLRVLVSLVNPADRVPAGAAARNAVQTAWDNVATFYNQASYGRLTVQRTLTANWHTLTGSFDDYVTTDPAVWYSPNIRDDQLDRLVAEAAQAAVDEGLNLDNFDVMACVIFLNGTFIRAWGGWSSNHFSYNDGAGTNIDITTGHQLNLLAIQETATWGRCAHELGHNIVSVPSGLSASPGSAVLREDVYTSDLVDPGAATAHEFEMMGSHDLLPLFSAYNLEKLGYYKPENILNLQWDRNAFSQEYEVVAHALTENSLASRYHLLKIRVGDGLYYYVEVRQRPGTTAQIFDPNIPLDGAPNDGGVIVTKVITGVMNINQQMRFITLLHDEKVLKQGDTAVDPARALKITVVNDHVVNRPLVCRVRVEWAQVISDDPSGAFDLRIEPWDSNWQTPDIWVDRSPFGVYDQASDSAGRPLGNGDKPRPGEINRLWARVHCDGAAGATNVNVTFYSVEPPGVGDNGNWAPLITRTIAAIPAGGHQDASANWVPEVGRHTCLKAYAGQQLGEISGSNNWAQENVFQFEAPASSVPDPVIMPVAVRNPLKEPTIVWLSITGVPYGYTVHFPHAWIWMDPLEERKLPLTVVPTLDYMEYRRKEVPRANVRLWGYVPRSYKEELRGGFPASRMLAIGGITARVTPKRRVTLRLVEDKERSKPYLIVLRGLLRPAAAGERIRVDLIDPDDRRRVAEATTDAGGSYMVQFDLRWAPTEEVKPAEPKKERPLTGVYTAQAFVVDSPNAAETESNLIHVTR